MKNQTKSIAENWKMNLIEKLGLEKCKAIFKDCKVCDLPCNFTHATDLEIKAGRRL